jgi:cardiolipin synthase
MLPNIISLLRLLLVPVIIGLVANEQWQLALYGFVIAGLSDAVDGYIARHYQLRTELGAYLDPLADKALLVSMFVTLGVLGLFPFWLVILVVTRDVLIVSGILLAWLLGSPIAMRPAKLSKLNTVGQILLVGTMMGVKAFEIDIPSLNIPLLMRFGSILVAALTLASMGLYILQWLKHFAKGQQ